MAEQLTLDCASINVSDDFSSSAIRGVNRVRWQNEKIIFQTVGLQAGTRLTFIKS